MFCRCTFSCIVQRVILVCRFFVLHITPYMRTALRRFIDIKERGYLRESIGLFDTPWRSTTVGEPVILHSIQYAFVKQNSGPISAHIYLENIGTSHIFVKCKLRATQQISEHE